MSDTVTFWMNAAAKYPLLSGEQTLLIAQKIQAAEPNSKEYTRLVNKLSNHNLRLVIKFARSYMNSSKIKACFNDENTADYLQQGYFGLRRACEKFDPTRGYAFSTYASAWIRQAMSRYHVENMSLIRVPESSAREFFFYEKNGFARNEKVSKWIEKTVDSARHAYGVTSYDAPVSGYDVNFMDVLSDANRLINTDNSESVNISEIHERCRKIMNELNINLKIQEVIFDYARRGNLDTVLAKFRMTSRNNRSAVRAAIAKIQESQREDVTLEKPGVPA